jgi:hypothetical protein
MALQKYAPLFDVGDASMRFEVPIVSLAEDFPEIPATARLAIAIPSVRWNPMTKSVLGSMSGVANEEVVVLVADNSENHDKRCFLEKLRHINPYILAVSHKNNIGGKNNFNYLYDWCKEVEFFALMGDDDWMSPTYHTDAYLALLGDPSTTGAEVGTTFVDIGDGQLVNVSQPSMFGNSPLSRMEKWNCLVARATMYNTSRRSTLDPAIRFLAQTPIEGMTMMEDMWELSRLAFGNFERQTGSGCFIHYPATGSNIGNQTDRFYNIFCKDLGLRYPFVYFLSLATAIQCAVFLMGNRSPITDRRQKIECGQYVFAHIFTTSFLPRVSAESSQSAAMELFATSPEALAGFAQYCNPPFSSKPTLDLSVIDWFISVIKVFESIPQPDQPTLSDRFRLFISEALGSTEFVAPAE